MRACGWGRVPLGTLLEKNVAFALAMLCPGQESSLFALQSVTQMGFCWPRSDLPTNEDDGHSDTAS